MWKILLVPNRAELNEMRFLPVFVDTAAGVIVLVGSGEPALGKLRLLRAAGAHVRWFSCDADVVEEVVTLPGEGQLDVNLGDPLEADLSDVVAIVSAAGDPLDTRVAARARRQRIPVNVVDRPELSTFIFPAIVDRGDVVVAISTGGASPLLASRLRELIEALLPSRIGDLAHLIGRHRSRFAAMPRGLSPRRFWQNVIAGPIAEAVLAGRGGEELEYLRQAGVPVVVVPGITAALGCAAESALPLTFRNEASKLTFVTAHRAEEAAAIDWSDLADAQTTVVVYMGLASAAAVRDGLIAAGRDPATAAAVLARGTRPDSQAAVGRLEQLPALAAEVGEGPAILVIGDVVARSAPWRAAELGALIAREAA
jgi:siroheme synthase-like protein